MMIKRRRPSPPDGLGLHRGDAQRLGHFALSLGAEPPVAERLETGRQRRESHVHQLAQHRQVVIPAGGE